MMAVSDGWRGAPFGVVDGWPRPLPDCTVVPAEAGITIGSLWLSDEGERWLAARTSLLSPRIDDHEGEERFGPGVRPDASQGESWMKTVPQQLVPAEARGGAAFIAWASYTQGADGRLLMWDAPPPRLVVGERLVPRTHRHLRAVGFSTYRSPARSTPWRWIRRSWFPRVASRSPHCAPLTTSLP